MYQLNFLIFFLIFYIYISHLQCCPKLNSKQVNTWSAQICTETKSSRVYDKIQSYIPSYSITFEWQCAPKLLNYWFSTSLSRFSFSLVKIISSIRSFLFYCRYTSSINSTRKVVWNLFLQCMHVLFQIWK